jgi:transposase-like protein
VAVALFVRADGSIRTESPTNTIEAFNSALRKVTNRKAAFPNGIAVFKILYLRTMDIAKKWVKPISDWAIVRGQLDIVLPDWDTA